MSVKPDDPEMRVAVFGRQVELFMQGEIGRYVIGEAEKQAIEAMNELERVAPWRRRKIQHLQNTIRVAKSIENWLAQAVRAGQLMAQKLEQENE